MAWLPAFNTALILISGCFLVLGYAFIRRQQRVAHHRCMLIATLFAGLFLVVYIARALTLGGKPFPGEGLAYMVYLGILGPHVVAAAAVAPLALVALRRAFRGDFLAHRRIARVTFPIWVFAAVTGWVIFVMLYVIDWGG